MTRSSSLASGRESVRRFRAKVATVATSSPTPWRPWFRPISTSHVVIIIITLIVRITSKLRDTTVINAGLSGFPGRAHCVAPPDNRCRLLRDQVCRAVVSEARNARQSSRHRVLARPMKYPEPSGSLSRAADFLRVQPAGPKESHTLGRPPSTPELAVRPPTGPPGVRDSTGRGAQGDEPVLVERSRDGSARNALNRLLNQWKRSLICLTPRRRSPGSGRPATPALVRDERRSVAERGREQDRLPEPRVADGKIASRRSPHLPGNPPRLYPRPSRRGRGVQILGTTADAAATARSGSISPA